MNKKHHFIKDNSMPNPLTKHVAVHTKKYDFIELVCDKVIHFRYVCITCVPLTETLNSMTTLVAEIWLHLLLSVFSSSRLCRTLWARSSWGVGVCVMSCGAVAASRGSISLWKSFFRSEKLLNVAQAASLTLMMTEEEDLDSERKESAVVVKPWCDVMW